MSLKEKKAHVFVRYSNEVFKEVSFMRDSEVEIIIKDSEVEIIIIKDPECEKF